MAGLTCSSVFLQVTECTIGRRTRAGPLFRPSEMAPQAVLLDIVSDGPPSHWEVGNPNDRFSRSNQGNGVLICASMTDKSFSNDGNVCSRTQLSST